MTSERSPHISWQSSSTASWSRARVRPRTTLALPLASAQSSMGRSTAVVAVPVDGIILDEAELHLHGDVLVPDIAGWLRERMPALPQASAFELAPDWVCEVLSPSTASVDRTEKLPIYGRERVGHVWLVDPLLQTLEVLRLDGAGYRIVGGWRAEAVVQCEPFEALPIRLADLWSA
jgi:Uma2 family endonuclease